MASERKVCDTAKMVKDKVQCRICWMCKRCAVHDGLMMRCPACERPVNLHCRRDANAAAVVIVLPDRRVTNYLALYAAGMIETLLTMVVGGFLALTKATPNSQ